MISIRHTGTRRLARTLRQDAFQYLMIMLRHATERGAQILRDAVKTGSYFRYRWPTRATGMLQRTVWAGPAKQVRGSVVAEAGWGVRYGPVLEFGPKGPHTWIIRAKFVQRLAFLGRGRGGKIGMQYPKQVTRRWNRGQLRPHWGPEVQRHGPQIERLFDGAIQKTKRRFGL